LSQRPAQVRPAGLEETDMTLVRDAESGRDIKSLEEVAR